MTRASDRGMSLLEVVVALALMATGVMATASAMDGSTKAVSAVDHRSRAVLLAQSTVEQLRSIPYASLGIDASLDGFVPTFEGRDTVVVGGSEVRPRSDEPGEGLTYRVERMVTWDDVVLGDGHVSRGAAKRLTVLVGWGADGAQVRLDSGISAVRQAVECAQRWIDAPSGSLTGVINTYLAGLGTSVAGATQLGVASDYRPGAPRKIEPGDLIVVMQMTGPDAGRYEYAIATTYPQGNVLGVTGRGFAGGLINGYGGSGVFQIVRVPTYGDAAIGADLSAAGFDGATGGVLAFDATGDVRFDTGVKVSAAGLAAASTARSADLARLSPGAGAPGEPGGGLVMVRAGSIIGGGELYADGASGKVGGNGGTIAIGLERGGLDGFVTVARGGAPKGLGGSVLTSAPPAKLAVGGADAGIVDGGVRLDDFVGVRLGAGCEAAVTTLVYALTPSIVLGAGAPAEYQVAVYAGPNRGGVAAMAVRVELPPGFTYRGTIVVDTKGDVQRRGATDPLVGDQAPRWAGFSMAPGSAFAIRFQADVDPKSAPGVSQTAATASYSSAAGSWLARYPAELTTGDDVTVKAGP